MYWCVAHGARLVDVPTYTVEPELNPNGTNFDPHTTEGRLNISTQRQLLDMFRPACASGCCPARG
jgi:hypothetical protein